MLLRMFKRSDKKKQDYPDIEKSTSGSSTPKGSGTSMDKDMTEKHESMSSTSVAEMPVEHIAESVSRIDDKSSLVQLGCDLTSQECQVSCVDDLEKKLCEKPIDSHSTPSNTQEHLTSDGNKKAELGDISLASSISESSKDRVLVPMPEIRNGSPPTVGGSALEDSPRTQDFEAEFKMQNPEGITCGTAVTELHKSKNDSDSCESSTGDDSDVEDSKKSESTCEESCGPIVLSTIGTGFSLNKCKSESGGHALVESKESKSISMGPALRHSIGSVSASFKQSSDDKKASVPGVDSNESLHTFTKDTVIENLFGINGKNEKSIGYKGHVNSMDEASVGYSSDSHSKCFGNVTSAPVVPREGSLIRNGNDVVPRDENGTKERMAKSNDIIPNLKKYIENEHNTCNGKNFESSKLEIKDQKDVSELFIEKMRSSEFTNASNEAGIDNTPNSIAGIPEKNSTCTENTMPDSEIGGNVKEESVKASVKKKSRVRRKNRHSESASLLASSVDSDRETECSLKNIMFTVSSSCHSCPHCTYSCLYNYSGKLCTIFGKQYIFTEVKGVPILVNLCEESFEVSMKNTCKILWREQTPLVLSSVEDGVEVSFDAVLLPELNKFSVLVIWHTRKPDIVTLPLEENLMFMGETTGFQVQLVSLNAKTTGVETGVLKATIDGQEETINFSAEVVFLNGAKVSGHVDLLGFFQFSSTTIYITVNKFLHLGSRDKYVYISTCVWRGVKPTNLLLSPPLNQSKLYKPHGSGTLPQEVGHYSMLHCDVPCKLLFTEGRGGEGCALSLPGRNFHLKFILDNKGQLIECPVNRFYCRNQRVALISPRAHLSIIVKAHILKHRLKGNTENFDVIMVQVPNEVVAFTLSESVSSLNLNQRMKVSDGLDSDRNKTPRVTNNLTNPNITSVKHGNPSDENLWKSSNVSDNMKTESTKNSNVSDNRKTESTTNTSQNKVDGLLSIVNNCTSISNLNIISESSGPSLASASKLCEFSLSKPQPAIIPRTPLSKNTASSSFHTPLEIDIPNTSSAEYSNCSSSSLQYYSPNFGSPMSSGSSYTSLSHVSSTKLTTTKTQPKKGNPSKQGTWSSGVLNFPNSSVQWSFGMPVNANSKAGAESSESKVAVSTKSLTSYSQVVKKSPEPELPSNVSIRKCQNPPKAVPNAMDKSVEGSPVKETMYKALCSIIKIAPKSGVLMVRGNLHGVSYPKAFFLAKVLHVNGAPLIRGNLNTFKQIIEPLKSKEWMCLLQDCAPINTSGVCVKYSTRMMWVGKVPQPLFGEYQKMYKIISVVPLKQLKPNIETTSSAALGLPTKSVPAVPSPKPQPILRRAVVVAVESTVGKLRSLLGPNSKELQFTRNNCFLYNISLENVCLKNILPCGLEVIYMELNGKVKDVIIEGASRDADLLDPATRYKLLKSWCEQYSVPIATRDTLLVAGGWLPPELNPTAAQESKIAIVNLQ